MLCRPCKGGESPELKAERGLERDVRGYLEMAVPECKRLQRLREMVQQTGMSSEWKRFLSFILREEVV